MFRLNQKDVASPLTRKRKRTSITDHEFGEIKFRRSLTSRHVRVRLMPDGRLNATLPQRAPVHAIVKLIDDSRDELRELVNANTVKRRLYSQDDQIGQSHRLRIEISSTDTPKVKIHHQQIEVSLPADWQISDDQSQAYVRSVCAKALRKEAEAYLPRRLRYLADTHGFEYSNIRFGNPKGRWGSYSSHGTISLNIALMTLPLELIDYVLIHELCHSRYPHHQSEFWEEVASLSPDYRRHRRNLRDYSPYL